MENPGLLRCWHFAIPAYMLAACYLEAIMYKKLPPLLLILLSPLALADALFESSDTINITIHAPLEQMRDDRDKDILYPGRLVHDGDTYNIKLSVRGNKRLMKATCKNPPLWLDFDKEETKDTMFDHQKHVKLVVLCRKGKVNFDYLRAEYLVYKMYETVTPVAFRTRWANVTYVESDGSTRTEPGFFIERKQRMAKRVGMEKVDEQRIDYADLHLDIAAVASLFNYIVSNPDFSLVSAMSGSCCHNAKLFLDNEGRYVPVLYDFDSSGVIAARYAAPNPALKIKKVTDRIYRGYCKHNDNMPAARKKLLAAESSFIGMVENDPYLSGNFKKKMNRFLGRSFAWVGDDATYNSKIMNKCRGEA